jgi:hypothetical protein
MLATLRIFFSRRSELTSSFHVIGEIFDKVIEGALADPEHNVQTTHVPGRATLVSW